MLCMNVLRKAMPEHVEALREPLFAAYRRIVAYQFERTDEAPEKQRIDVVNTNSLFGQRLVGYWPDRDTFTTVG